MKAIATLRLARHWVAGISVTAVVLGSFAAQPTQKTKPAKSRPAATKQSSVGKPTPQRQNELKREQRELQAELAKLRRQLAASEASRSEATDALASSEIAISKANRRLRELAGAREQVERQIEALSVREREIAGRQGERQQQLDRLLRQQQTQALRNALLLALEGENPNRPARDSVYLSYIARDAESSVTTLQARRAEIVSLQAQSKEKSAELAKINEDEVNNQQLLERELARRKRTLTNLSKAINSQRQSISRLQRDEQRLGKLIDQISRVLAEQARKEAERARRLAEREAEVRKSAARRETPPAATPPASSAKPSSSSGNFAQQKGKLPLPVQGTIASRFGSVRRGDGGSAGPTWKGLFLTAPAGADVHAVGDGQIVFADWLRGFGNLLVIDHGDGYLSVYGNNDALLRNVGDRVAVGEVVATVGNTGSSESPGLYFELRFQGRPFDPLTWVAAR